MWLIRYIRNRWYETGGYKEVLFLAFPLIVSTGAWSIQHFVDRMFLTWYSPEAIAASTPAGMLNFTIMSLFIGTGMYVNTFVAQYWGVGRYDRIGPAVWQGLYVALIGGIVLLFIVPTSDTIFRFVGHDPVVMEYETIYFKILCLGATPAIASSVMSGFFSGRGETRPVMWVNVFAICVNIVMDYLLIFGHAGFPELGIAGAAIATVIATLFNFIAYIILASGRVSRRTFRFLSGWRLDPDLFGRLMRYGVPNGVQFALEITGYTFFILVIGRKGTEYLAASNIALNINSLAFHPMLGLGMAISILVGQYLGAEKSELAEHSVYSGFHMTFTYMSVIAALYVIVPNLFLAPYGSFADAESFEAIRHAAIVILRFVAFYSLFDALNIVFSYAIKGAGDTKFVMKVIVSSSLLVLVVPSYVFMILLDGHPYLGWTFATTFIIILGVSFTLRFLGGKWKEMRVIETVPPPVPASLPEAPGVEFEP